MSEQAPLVLTPEQESLIADRNPIDMSVFEGREELLHDVEAREEFLKQQADLERLNNLRSQSQAPEAWDKRRAEHQENSAQETAHDTLMRRIDEVDQAFTDGEGSTEAITVAQKALKEELESQNLRISDLARTLAWAEFVEDKYASVVIEDVLNVKMSEREDQLMSERDNDIDHNHARRENIIKQAMSIKERELARLNEGQDPSIAPEQTAKESKEKPSAQESVSVDSEESREKAAPKHISYEKIGDEFTWEEFMSMKAKGGSARALMTREDGSQVYAKDNIVTNLETGIHWELEGDDELAGIILGENWSINGKDQGVFTKFEAQMNENSEDEFEEQYNEAEAVLQAHLEEDRANNPEVVRPDAIFDPGEFDELDFLPDAGETAGKELVVYEKQSRMKRVKNRFSALSIATYTKTREYFSNEEKGKRRKGVGIALGVIGVGALAYLAYQGVHTSHEEALSDATPLSNGLGNTAANGVIDSADVVSNAAPQAEILKHGMHVMEAGDNPWTIAESLVRSANPDLQGDVLTRAIIDVDKNIQSLNGLNPSSSRTISVGAELVTPNIETVKSLILKS